MSKQTITRLVDDIDGGDAHETIPFALDGHAYEIDLSNKNAEKLRVALNDFVSAAVSIKNGAPRGRRATVTAVSSDQNTAIREWAARTGREVAPRGRISQSVIAEYNADKRHQPPAVDLFQPPVATPAVKRGRKPTAKAV